MKAPVLREGTPQEVGMDPARIARVRELVAGWVKSGETPSVVALVARRGVVVLHEAFGVRHFEDTTPTLRRDSIFPLASCSKPITAAAVMCLVEDGVIGLNRRFVDYVPEWDIPGREGLAEACVADLLCHISGLDDVALDSFIEAAASRSPDLPPPAPGRHPTLDKRIRLAAGASLARAVGSAMVYSNFGYLLLGDIVRQVSGQPFWQFVQSRIFAPLGMVDSSFALPSEMRARRVYRKPGLIGTAPTPTTRGIDSPEYDEMDLGSIGAASTSKDLAVFLQMLLNRGRYGDHQILSPASVAAMTRPQVDRTVPSMMTLPLLDPATGKRIEIKLRGGSYGYGLFLFTGDDRFGPNGALASPSAFGHIGFGGTCIWADPERELLGVFLSVSGGIYRGVGSFHSDLFQNAVHAAILE